MLHYGDRARTVVPRDVVRRVADRLDRARALPDERRAAVLLAALIEAGELAQGLADRAFEREGHDGDDAHSTAALELTVAIARTLCATWWSAGAPRWPDATRLTREALPSSVRVNVAEGYAHYALYPETYAEAARRARGRSDRWFVVGIRSIGTSLAAVVAAGCEARDALTVRPVGHPYDRRLQIAPALDRTVRAAIRAGAQFAVVDEGPGLSGSSFAAAGRWLDDAGAAPGQVTFFPSHLGELGPAAPDGRRRWWSGTHREVAAFEEVVVPSIAAAVERAYGPGSLEDAGGGRWRATLRPGGGPIPIPPVFRSQERRKYVCHREHGGYVVRFAGLGRFEEETRERAETLAAAGWSPAPRAVYPGFLGTPVVARSTLAERDGGSVGAGEPHQRRRDSPSAEEIERYLEFRAGAFPAGPDTGAAPDQLLTMLRVNAAEALGIPEERWADAHAPAVHASAGLPRVAIDGKLEPWEWARAEDGKLWKLDATDHAFGHDLVGCQPATWDVAGASVELGLSPERAVALGSRLCAGPGASTRAKETVAAVLRFHEAAYLAHRIGRWTFALQLETDPDERALVEAVLGRYKGLLRRRIACQ